MIFDNNNTSPAPDISKSAKRVQIVSSRCNRCFETHAYAYAYTHTLSRCIRGPNTNTTLLRLCQNFMSMPMLMQVRNLTSHGAQRLARSIDVEFAALLGLFEILFPLRVHGHVCALFAKGGGVQEAGVEGEADAGVERGLAV